MKRQGQQGSPRGITEKETNHTAMLMEVYTTREMLLADGNNRVRCHVALYFIMWNMMTFLIRLNLSVSQFTVLVLI